MKEYWQQLIMRHRSPGVVIDANLLLLLLVGDLSLARIEQFKPTRSHFIAADYRRLREILSPVGRLVVTPQILTEVSNFLNQSHSTETLALRNLLANALSVFDIQDVHISALVNTSDGVTEFCKFGLTDAVIIHLARKGYLVVTINFELAQYIQSDGHDSINYMNASCSSITDKKWG